MTHTSCNSTPLCRKLESFARVQFLRSILMSDDMIWFDCSRSIPGIMSINGVSNRVQNLC